MTADVGERWTLIDDTGKGRGYLRIECDGRQAADVFPFAARANEAETRRLAIAIVGVLNAAERWRRVSHQSGTTHAALLVTDEGEMLRRAVDAALKARQETP